ncbi:MAG: BatA domain-containing protein [Verrucomicrobiales bacterium]
MTFLNPFLLYGLLAVSIPIIIHLLNRRRFRTVKWGAMQFLLKASQESRGKKRLKHIIILACRALAIAALIFAISRPLVGGLLGWGGGSLDTVIIILDRSASMELRAGDAQASLRESSLTRLTEAAGEIKAGQVLFLDSATGEIQDIPDLSALPLLSTTAPTSTQANIPALLNTAIDHLAGAQAGRSEIWLASDLQEADWKAADNQWEAIRSGLANLPSPPKLRILTASPSAQSNNQSLELLSARRSGDELLLDLRLTRRQDQGQATLPLTYVLNGARSAERITISGQDLRFQKRLQLPAEPASGHGWIALPADHNPQDNEVFFAYGPPEPIQSYLVTSQPGPSAEALAKAAAPPDYARQDCQILQPAQAQEIDWQRASLIIWQAPLPTGELATRLREFIAKGGSFLALPPGASETASDASFLGLFWGALQKSPADQYFITGSSLRDDGPWQDGANGTPLPLDKLQAIQRREIIGEAAVLAEWDDNSPLLLRQIEGRGSAIFLNTLPDYQWSNLEHTALHLVAIQRLLALGNERLHDDHRALAGTPAAHPGPGESAQRLDEAREADPANAPYLAGVYRFGERLVALNRPESESSLERLDRSKLNQLLDGTEHSLFEENAQSDSSLVQEIWRAFLIAMILFLLAEALLCLQPKTASRAVGKMPSGYFQPAGKQPLTNNQSPH